VEIIFSPRHHWIAFIVSKHISKSADLSQVFGARGDVLRADPLRLQIQGAFVSI